MTRADGQGNRACSWVRRTAVQCVNVWLLLVALLIAVYFLSIDTGSLFRPAPWIRAFKVSIWMFFGLLALVVVVVIVHWYRAPAGQPSSSETIRPKTAWQLFLTCALACAASTYAAHVYSELIDAMARAWPGTVSVLPGEVISASSFGSEFVMSAAIAGYEPHTFTFSTVVGVTRRQGHTRALGLADQWRVGGGGPAKFTIKENRFGISLLWAQRFTVGDTQRP